MSRSWTAAAGSLLLAFGALVRHNGGSNRAASTFVAVSLKAPALSPLMGLPREAHAVTPAAAPADSTGSCSWIASAGLLGAAAAAARGTRRRSSGSSQGMTFSGAPAATAVANLASAQPGYAGEESVIAMCGVKKRPHVRIKDRTLKDWMRGRRKNSAAKKRFLIKPDGSMWRRQAGLRHLKSKKSPAHLKRLGRMVRIDRKAYGRIGALLGRIPRKQTAADFIMTKFNEARANKHLWTSDRGVGTALFC